VHRGGKKRSSLLRSIGFSCLRFDLIWGLIQRWFEFEDLFGEGIEDDMVGGVQGALVLDLGL